SRAGAGSVLRPQLSRDGKLVTVTDLGGGVQVKEIAGGRTIARVDTSIRDERVVDIGPSPDGGRVVTGGADGTAGGYDVATGAQVARFQPHLGALWTAQFSPDGRSIVTGGRGETLDLWPANGGARIARLRDRGGLYTARFSQFGGLLRTLDHDGHT